MYMCVYVLYTCICVQKKFRTHVYVWKTKTIKKPASTVVSGTFFQYTYMCVQTKIRTHVCVKKQKQTKNRPPQWNQVPSFLYMREKQS